jgi:hypothetical protein
MRARIAVPPCAICIYFGARLAAKLSVIAVCTSTLNSRTREQSHSPLPRSPKGDPLRRVVAPDDAKSDGFYQFGFSLCGEVQSWSNKTVLY